MANIIEKYYRIIIAAILLFMATVSFLNAKNESAIFDETAHIPAGYSYIALGDMRLNPEHPPLIKDLAGIPLAFMDLNFDTSADFWTNNPDGQWEAGRSLLWKSGNDADKIIFWSRVPIVLLSILLGFFIFKWVRELAGISAGLFALALYAFDPNILGHNHFVTTDIGIAAFMVFSFYYFLRFIKEPSWKNVLIGGIFLGLVQLAKFSSVILFPVFGLVLVIYPLAKAMRDKYENPGVFKLKKLFEYLIKGACAFAISILVVWGVYAINTRNMPRETLAKIIDYQFRPESEMTSVKTMNNILSNLNESHITKPMSEYLLGLGMVFKRVAGGNGAYFMGQVSSSAFPAYFPTVFILKEPLIILFFMLSALFLAMAKNIWAFFSGIYEKEKLKKLSEYLRHNVTGLSLFAFISLYAYTSVTGNLNIGFRHLFPILPFIYILTAKSIFGFIKRMDLYTKKVWLAVILILSIFLAVGTARAYPYYMSYFNKIAGGSQNGYRYVTDSNADWGQDLLRLKDWIGDYNYCARMKCDPELKIGCPKLCYLIADELKPDQGKPIEKIRVNYFGGADIKYYFGDTAIDWWDTRRPIEPGWYAISTNYLMGSIYDKEKKDDESYRWLKNIKPLTQVGTAIFIYYLEVASS